jgi:hypothetical protein
MLQRIKICGARIRMPEVEIVFSIAQPPYLFANTPRNRPETPLLIVEDNQTATISRTKSHPSELKKPC